jgi:acyl transferase domain-containing protein
MGSNLRSRIGQLSRTKLELLATKLLEGESPASYIPKSIAVIGAACRIPAEVSSLKDYLELLETKRQASTGSANRQFHGWDSSTAELLKQVFFLSGVDGFDADFFGFTPREAQTTDPQQRLVLEMAWEALESAGYARNGEKRNIGVYVGACAADYQHLLRSRSLNEIDGYYGTGSYASLIAGRVSYLLGLTGPSMVIDTACSSSLVAMHQACNALRAGQCDMALCGGINLVLTPEANVAFGRAGMLSPDGCCKTFDEAADGYVRAEAGGMVLLKPLDRAMADRDNILMVIKGSAVNQDGRSQGLTAPNGTAQEELLRNALADARLTPDAIGYVEAHGTGTALGDPIEAHALGRVFSEGPARASALQIGSVKTVIGHAEAAAGMAGLLKVLLAFQHETLLPHLNFTNPSSRIRWDHYPIEVNTGRTPWLRGAKPRRAGVSSFGFSGTNAHVIVEEAPVRERMVNAVERPRHVLALSARNTAALDELAARYADYLETSTEPLADICHTAGVGRNAFKYRLAVTGSDREEMRATLRDGVMRGEAGAPRIAWLFSGQGSQYAGMGRQLYDTQPTFRGALDRCAALLRTELEVDLLALLWGGAIAEFG